jgi:signal transduction histidine kinase
MKMRVSGKMKRASLRTIWLYPVLALLWLGIAAWLWQEQKQHKRLDEESQRAQGRVLIETVASSIRSQSLMSMYRPERLQAILEAVAANPGVLALALFDARGSTVASAGTIEKLARSPARGSSENWTSDTLQLWSPVRIGEIPWHLGPEPPEQGPRGPRPTPGAERPRRMGSRERAERPRNPGSGPGGLEGRGTGFRPRERGGPRFPPRFRPGSEFFLTVLLPLQSLRESSTAGARLRLLVAAVTFLLLLVLAMGWRASLRGVALRSSLALAEEQNRYLREMNLAASGLAHETKNPLNAVRMAAQTLAAATPDSADWKGKAKLIADEVDRLDARINEWLAFSRPREPKPKEVELEPLFEELRTLISPDADEKKAQLSLRGDRAIIWADTEMLRQLLFNLLLNGVQALEEGGHLQVNVEPQKDGNISIVVEDDGVGVPSQHRDQLFSPYFTTRANGSGLGLAICRRIARAHGWRLRYRPRDPRGSMFTVDGIALVKEPQ